MKKIRTNFRGNLLLSYFNFTNNFKHLNGVKSNISFFISSNKLGKHQCKFQWFAIDYFIHINIKSLCTYIS